MGILSHIKEGDSANVLQDIYFTCSIFGVEIKLEYNSYDFDDEYKYMLSVKEDFLSFFEVDKKILNKVTEIVVELLLRNVKIELAFEQSKDKPQIFTDKDINQIVIDR